MDRGVVATGERDDEGLKSSSNLFSIGQLECSGTEEETGEEGSCKLDQVLFRLRFQNLVNPDKDNVLGRATGGEVFE